MKNYKFIFLIFLPLNLIFLVGIWFSFFSITHFLYFLMGYVFISGLGVEVGLHRWASHRSVELNKISKFVVTYASILSCQGHPIWWAAVHRGYHHRHADSDQDVHSPSHGFYNSFLGWIIKHDPKSINYKYATDLLKSSVMNTTSKFYEVIIWTTWIAVGLIDFHLLLWFLVVPTVISFYGVGLINSFGHGKFGYRNFETKDKSRNIPILGILLWGNGWHNNHHYMPSSYDFGSSVSNKKLEIDPCVFLLPFIKKQVT